MTFTSAIKQCYHKAFTLRGRASRSEYWFFCLYLLILCFVLVTIMVFMDSNLQDDDSGLVPNLMGLSILLSGLALFIHIVPMFSVTLRRLHDGNMPGWLLLLSIIPVGNLILFIFMLLPFTPGDNPYGPNPHDEEKKEYEWEQQ